MSWCLCIKLLCYAFHVLPIICPKPFNSRYLYLFEALAIGHVMVSRDGEVQTNKCLFIKAGPVCDLTVCQKSIYLAEQGGRSRPGLKNWVSGRLSPSALSQLGMRVLHHPTRSVTSAGHTGGKEQWGVLLSTSTFLVVRPGLL